MVPWTDPFLPTHPGSPACAVGKAALTFAWASHRHGRWSSLQSQQLPTQTASAAAPHQQAPGIAALPVLEKPESFRAQCLGHGPQGSLSGNFCVHLWRCWGNSVVHYTTDTWVPFCWSNELWETDRGWGERWTPSWMQGELRQPQTLPINIIPTTSYSKLQSGFPAGETVFPCPLCVSKDQPALYLNALPWWLSR